MKKKWIYLVIGFVYSSILFTSCSDIPSNFQTGVVRLNKDTAFIRSIVSDDGWENITERGVCWDTLPNPTIAKNKLSIGRGIGDDTCIVTGLIQGKKYYARAYGINKKGVGYDFHEKQFHQISIGGTCFGGLVAYIVGEEEEGYIEGEPHGLIVAPYDQSAGIIWDNGKDTLTNNGSYGDNGKINTDRIVSVLGEGKYAAKICCDLVLNGYEDWYLPSYKELNTIHYNRLKIGSFIDGIYWTSSEEYYLIENNATTINFNLGYPPQPLYIYGKNKDKLYRVRAIRYF